MVVTDENDGKRKGFNWRYQINSARLIRKVNIGCRTKTEDNLTKNRREFWHSSEL